MHMHYCTPAILRPSLIGWFMPAYCQLRSPPRWSPIPLNWSETNAHDTQQIVSWWHSHRQCSDILLDMLQLLQLLCRFIRLLLQYLTPGAVESTNAQLVLLVSRGLESVLPSLMRIFICAYRCLCPCWQMSIVTHSQKSSKTHQYQNEWSHSFLSK